MQNQMDIIIAGGGIAGLTLGILLAEAGFQIHLIDPRRPAPVDKVRPSGRTVALMENSLNIIRATGIWDMVKNHAAALRMMKIHDASISNRDPVEVAFPAFDIGLEQFGFNIPNHVLHAALFKKAQELNSLTYIEDALSDYKVSAEGVTAHLENGKKIRAPLIIGADGRNSLVRAIARIETREHDYRQTAITCLINHSKAHENISTEFHRPVGPLALVPLPGNQSSVVWVEPTRRADEIVALRKQDFTDLLQKESHGALGGITLEAGPESWPLKSIRAKSITAPRMALAAEAAHVMSPITAQGLNLSLRDVASLAETLVDAARLGLDIGAQSILEKYERRRALDIRTRVFGVDTMNRIVSTDLAAIKGGRRNALKMLDSLPAFKGFAMRQGLAPDNDKSRLAEGLPL